MNLLIKLFKLAFSMRKQFIKYFITGLCAVTFDIVTLYAFKEFFNLRPVIAVIVNQIIILNFVFFVNKYWSFKSDGMTSRQMFRFLIVAVANYIFAIVWMWTVNEKLGVNYLFTRIINIALSVSWNFLLYRYFVYSPEISPATEVVVSDNVSQTVDYSA